MPLTCYSFKQNGWKFIALNSISHDKDGREYELGEEQMTWPENELEKTEPSIPLLIFLHIPIVGVVPIMYYVNCDPINKVRYPGYDKHADLKKIKGIFYQHNNIKISLSKLIYNLDVVDYLV